MPRVTKKQKEAGKAPGSKVSHGGARGAQPERKKGFHVGPAHAAKDAYLGKAKKIKADLIMRAKMKKSYAKVLKQEGMGSERLSRRTGDEARGMVPEQAGTGSGLGEGDEDEDEDETKGEDEGTGRGESSRSGAGKSRERERDIESRMLGRSSSRGSTRGGGPRGPGGQEPKVDPRGKGKGRAHPNDHGDTENDSRKPFQPIARTSSGGTRARALSPSAIGPPMPITSLRTLKKEAFSKYHAPRRRDDGVRPAGAGGGGGPTTGGGRGGRGQPNMGARMGALLEKIRRDRV
ncbi:hypothetical protein EHS25_006483 [Saitozyma podzolica]|uniref:rRNA-processing protein FYV7 n=1 Tax=Saitozyma podzolica TaxID=1890683 RepID=A0A427YRT3_9TREE|nr:hypothetical protein EHS25_006483 [Saitozyma podzolica]